MKDLIIAICLAGFGTPFLLWMMSDKVSSKIRQSNSWWAAWLGYLLLMPNVVAAWFYLLDIT